MEAFEVLKYILSYIDKIESWFGEMTYDEFTSNEMYMDACAFNLEHLGEYVTRLDNEFTAKYPAIPWRDIRGLRNQIAHNYEHTEKDIIWQVVKEDLPQLREQLENILNN